MKNLLFLPEKHLRIFFLSSIVFLAVTACTDNQPIDRQALVTRHNVTITSPDSLSPVSVGNGDFAFTVDVTGLQTFPEFYEHGIPLGTMSNWGWHTWENPSDYSLDDVYRTYDVHGRKINYVHQFRMNEDSTRFAASEWLRNNPHRIHLGMIGLRILNKEGREAEISEIKDPVQTLDLWSGRVTSRFMVDDVPVSVETVCHPDRDLVSAIISSPLISERRLMVRIDFPLGISAPAGYDLNSPDGHATELISSSDSETLIGRTQDDDSYFVKVLHPDSRFEASGKHQFLLISDNDSIMEFSCQFGKEKEDGQLPDFSAAAEAGRIGWEKFWMSGGAVDFSACTDPRAFELERRVVLSQYLTKLQCSGSLPPAETGLTYNSWYGKFHLEMHWWHAVHFAMWQREEILE
ncbi:MAG: hypothetical protein RBS38_10610, partial [Bacteroidales bacterium]|nr:hypothetical protein [Bacteroidales bacterium]